MSTASGSSQSAHDRFVAHLRAGAGTQDIHDSTSATAYALPAIPSEELIRREVDRVRLHQKSLCPLLEHHVGKASQVLDVGCSTGGTTVAVALSDIVGAEQVVGADPNASSIEAARLRAETYGLPESRVTFDVITPNRPLPFDDGQFDLTLCVSVIEYVHSLKHRKELAGELQRVTRKDGHIFVATPSPFRLRDYHTKRFFGDFRRHSDHPWASTPGQLRSMFESCSTVPIGAWQVRQGLLRRGVRIPLPSFVWAAAAKALTWQKLLLRKL